MSQQVWGVTMVRDEADVIEQTLRHLHAEGLAGVIALDNGSVDGTRVILERLRGELRWGDAELPWLRIVDDPEPGYWQASKMTSAAGIATQLGAAWVVPFDADEIWYDPIGRPLADAILLDARPGVTVREAWLYDHRVTALDAPPGPPDTDDPFTRMTWRAPDRGYLPKVAIRTDALQRIAMGNHSAAVKFGTKAAGIEVRHFPYRSADQFVRKARNGAEAINATTMDRGTCQHWREYGETLRLHGEGALREHFAAHFTYNHPEAQGLVNDPAPIRLGPS